MIKKYDQFLNESTREIKRINVGDWIFISNDPNPDDGFTLNSRLGQRIEYKSSSSIKIKFTESFINGMNTYHLYNYRNNIDFEIVDEKTIKEFNNKKLAPLVRTEAINFILRDINFEYETYFYDYSYFDISNTNDTITCLPVNKINPVEDPWTSSSRQIMRLGKFFKKLNKNIPAKKLEKFINDYKSKYDQLNGVEVKIVEGEDIRYWYLEDNYAEGGGKLNSSCMRYEESQERFDIYCKNPKKIKMAIIIDKNKKLLGRALIWKLDKPVGKIYMDRIYTVNDYMTKFFIDYAKKNDMFIYEDSDDHMEMNIEIDVEYDGGNKALYPRKPHPYMDTFRNYYDKEKKLCNQYDYGDDPIELDDHD